MNSLKILAFLPVFLVCITYNIPAQPLKEQVAAVIFDTDMGPDYDDVGAITLLHAMADSGECKILATMASDKHQYVAATLNVLNTYFKRPKLPIGVVRGNAVDISAFQKWDSIIVSRYPHQLKSNDEAEDALSLYRKILSVQPDQSVTIVTVGFLTNISNLLKSRPDKYSSLNGRDLVKRKVKQLVCMAACFDNRMGTFREFNVMKDVPASTYAFDNWPGKIIFSGFEIGAKIFTGLPITKNENIHHSPVKDVFSISIPMDPQDKNGRMSWDETAVLVAVRDPLKYFDMVEGKYISKDDGSNEWNAKGKNHFYLKHKFPPEYIAEVIDGLMMHEPWR